MRWMIVALLFLIGSCNDKDDSVEAEVPVEAFAVTTLAQGDQPTIGNVGPKEIRVIRNEDEFVDAWFDYSPNEIPSVDFSENVVVLYDRGSTDINQCGSTPTFEHVSAALFDHSIMVVSVHLEQRCEQVACADFVSPGRPFVFVSVPAANVDDVLVSQMVDVSTCDERSGEQPVGTMTLDEGSHPVIGDFGPARMMVINDEDTLSYIWPQYSDDDIPQIDFSNKAVVLHDEGLTDLNSCALKVRISGVTADKVDTGIGTEIATVNFNTQPVCLDPLMICTAEVVLGRPYRFLEISQPYNHLSGDMLLSENLEIQPCES